MSLAISSLSLLPALFNSLRSCSNDLISATSVFNPALLTAVRSATSAVRTQQSLCRIYPKGPNFTFVSLLHVGFAFWGYARPRSDTVGMGGLLATCTQPHAWQDTRYLNITQQFQNWGKKVKMGKTETLPGLRSSTAPAIKRLMFSHSKSTNAVLGKASQERALRLLGRILDDDISKFKMSAIKKEKKKKKKEHSL